MADLASLHAADWGHADIIRDVAGILACLDGYMNIAMEQTEVRQFHCSDALMPYV